MRRAALLFAIAVAAVATVGIVESLGGSPTPATAQTGAAPDVATGQATDVAQQTAKLSGTVNPNGTATTYTFQFGTSASYGAETTPASAGTGTTSSTVSASLSGLAPGTTYHYRITATNSDGQSTSGVDRTLTTLSRASSLGLFGHTAFVGPGRQVGVFTGCLGDRSCRGSLKMTANGATIGTRSFFFIKPGGGGIVHVPLNSTGRRLAASGRHFRTSVTVSSSQAGKDSASVTVVPYK
jgi:hypothetical protein